MWTGNHEASAAHLKIVRHFIPQIGGINRLELYVMKSLILGDKYLALGHHVLGPEIQTIVADLVACLRIAHSICKLPCTDPVDERWLFLRHQALIYCLLLASKTTALQECVRLALLAWILKVTKYFGAQPCSISLLSQLKHALLPIEPGVVIENAELLFWVVCAVVADGTADRDWFVRQAGSLATSLELDAREDHFKLILNRWLFVKSETGAQITKLVCAVREMQMAGHGMEDLVIITLRSVRS